jgi:prohibitin 2
MAFEFKQSGGFQSPPGNIPPNGNYRGFLRSLSRTAVIVVVVVVALVLGSMSFTVIEEGFVGVKYQLGRIVATDLGAGLNFKLPFVQTVRTVDVREQLYETSTNAYTMDTQTVENLAVKLNYLYDRSMISDLIRNVGINNVESKLIIPQLQSTMKNEIGRVRAEALVQNRSAIQENIEEDLRESLAVSGIIVVSFAMENIDFEDGFEESIRAKVAAEQQALTMQNKTKEKEEQAKQQVIEAQALADSEKLKADAQAYSIEIIQKQLQESPEYVQFLQVDKWNGQLPQFMGSDVNPFVSIGALQ